MKRIYIGIIAVLLSSLMTAQNVNVDFSVEEGPVKYLNGVNGGIQESSHAGSTMRYVRDAHIP